MPNTTQDQEIWEFRKLKIIKSSNANKCESARSMKYDNQPHK